MSDAGRLIFNIAIMELERTLADCAVHLGVVSAETLERLAGGCNAVANEDEMRSKPPIVREKALAMVALLTAAAEYKRAATRYSKATLEHALGAQN